MFRFADRWWAILSSEPDRETYVRNGTPQQIEARLRRCLSDLESIQNLLPVEALHEVQWIDPRWYKES